MTQTGSPYDNAIAERVNGILKHQLGLGQVFKNYAAAVEGVCSAVAMTRLFFTANKQSTVKLIQ